MHDLSLNILDMVENSIDAKATRIKILVEENLVKDKLRITIVDNGVGMDKKNISKITDPFVTTKTCRKVGLGLPLLKVKAQQCHGDLSISSFLGKGTTIKIVFQYANIDRPPLGNIALTLMCIILANPCLDIIYQHSVERVFYKLDTSEIKKIVGKDCFRKKDIRALISQDIKEGFSKIEKEREKSFKKIYGYVPRVNLV